MLLFQAPDIANLAVTVATSLVVIGVGAATNYVVATKASSKFEGAVGARLDSVDERLDRNDKNQDDQWSKINKHTGDIAHLQGALGAKAAKHHG